MQGQFVASLRRHLVLSRTREARPVALMTLWRSIALPRDVSLDAEFLAKVIACTRILPTRVWFVADHLSRPMDKRFVDPSVSAQEATELLLRIATVVRVTGLGRSTIYRLVAHDQFPSPVRLTRKAVGWRRVDVERWTNAREAVRH